MNKYHIALRADGSGFNVHVETSEGARQTLLGFATEADARVWIAQDQRLDLPTDRSQDQQEQPTQT